MLQNEKSCLNWWENQISFIGEEFGVDTKINQVDFEEIIGIQKTMQMEDKLWHGLHTKNADGNARKMWGKILINMVNFYSYSKQVFLRIFSAKKRPCSAANSGANSCPKNCLFFPQVKVLIFWSPVFWAKAAAGPPLLVPFKCFALVMASSAPTKYEKNTRDQKNEAKESEFANDAGEGKELITDGKRRKQTDEKNQRGIW